MGGEARGAEGRDAEGSRPAAEEMGGEERGGEADAAALASLGSRLTLASLGSRLTQPTGSSPALPTGSSPALPPTGRSPPLPAGPRSPAYTMSSDDLGAHVLLASQKRVHGSVRSAPNSATRLTAPPCASGSFCTGREVVVAERAPRRHDIATLSTAATAACESLRTIEASLMLYSNCDKGAQRRGGRGGGPTLGVLPAPLPPSDHRRCHGARTLTGLPEWRVIQPIVRSLARPATVYRCSSLSNMKRRNRSSSYIERCRFFSIQLLPLKG